MYTDTGEFSVGQIAGAEFLLWTPAEQVLESHGRALRTKYPGQCRRQKKFLHEQHIALYDVIESCIIKGSSDSSIKDAEVTDLEPVLRGSCIGRRIYTNGSKAYDLYGRYTLPLTGIKAVKLPSTSPANAAFSLEKLTEIWRERIGESYDWNN